MTIGGTVNKPALALVVLLISAGWTWGLDLNVALLMGLLGLTAGLVVAILTAIKQTWAPYTTPVYAALEGLALGAISKAFELRYPGSEGRRNTWSGTAPSDCW